jgi:hypothetical protein
MRPLSKDKPPNCRLKTLWCATATTGKLPKAPRVPAMLLDLMTQGGLYPHLEGQGLITPKTAGG